MNTDTRSRKRVSVLVQTGICQKRTKYFWYMGDRQTQSAGCIYSLSVIEQVGTKPKIVGGEAELHRCYMIESQFIYNLGTL
jgi:hypothetical protein